MGPHECSTSKPVKIGALMPGQWSLHDGMFCPMDDLQICTAWFLAIHHGFA